MDFIKSEFTVFQTLDYYLNYFKIFYQILLHHNSKYIQTVKLIIQILLYQALHFLYMYIFPIDSIDRIVHFDAYFVILPKPIVNLMAFLITLMTAIYFQHHYLSQSLQLNGL